MIFLTSDTHFGHEGIIMHCNRPFSSVEEMDAEMILRWNATVRPTDTVYHLGDFAWHSRRAHIEDLLSRLSGTKHLVVGNHDHRVTRTATGWASVQYAMVLKTGGLRHYLSHYPVQGFREDLLLHGHQHNEMPVRSPRQVDVGVDAWNFAPVSLWAIRARIAEDTAPSGPEIL